MVSYKTITKFKNHRFFRFQLIHCKLNCFLQIAPNCHITRIIGIFICTEVFNGCLSVFINSRVYRNNVVCMFHSVTYLFYGQTGISCNLFHIGFHSQFYGQFALCSFNLKHCSFNVNGDTHNTAFVSDSS